MQKNKNEKKNENVQRNFYPKKNKFKYNDVEYLGTDEKTLLQMHNVENAKDTDQLIDAISTFVKEKGKHLSTSQIRNIYDAILEIDNDNFGKIKLFRPKLA